MPAAASPARAPVAASPAAPPAAPPTPSAPSLVPERSSSPATLAGADDWIALVPALGLKGPALQLGSHAQFHGYQDGVLRLHLPPEDAHLRSEASVRKLVDALGAVLGEPPQLRFEAVAAPAGAADTLQQRQARERDARQSAAEASFHANPVVATLLAQGGTLAPDSIRPLPET
jgi:DNA polymerase-3 subunit gamma/tau